MVKYNEQQSKWTEDNENGEVKLWFSNLGDFEKQNDKLGMFALASLKPGEEVGFHIHEGESETYYIISGKGIYNDNGTEVEICPKAVTFTPSGTGHGIKNTGDEMLEFLALIIKD